MDTVKRFTSIYDGLAIEMNRCLEEYQNGWPKERPPWSKKAPSESNRPQQIQNHNVPTDDVENTNSTNLLFTIHL